MSYLCLMSEGYDEAIKNLESLIKEKNFPKEKADNLRTTFKLSAKIQEYAYDILRGAPKDIFVDAFISAFQSMLSNHLLMIDYIDGKFDEVKPHLERLLNASLERFNLKCEISKIK